MIGFDKSELCMFQKLENMGIARVMILGVQNFVACETIC